MNNETRTLWISVVAGVFAMFLVYSFLQEQKSEIVKPYGGMENVIVATKDINELSTIDDTMVEIQQKPHDFMQPEAVNRIEEAVGLVAVAPVRKGEQILRTKLLQPGPETGISLQIQPNKRAISVQINEFNAVSRLIRPGDRVDIIAAIDVGKGMNQKREVSTIMFDIPVLATGVSVRNNIPRVFDVDSSTNKVTQLSLVGDTKYTSITLELSPKESQDLVYLTTANSGNIYFTLKNPNDRTANTRLPSSTAESILGRPAFEAPPAAAAAQPPVIQLPAGPVPASMGPPISSPPKTPRKGFKTL